MGGFCGGSVSLTHKETGGIKAAAQPSKHAQQTSLRDPSSGVHPSNSSHTSNKQDPEHAAQLDFQVAADELAMLVQTQLSRAAEDVASRVAFPHSKLQAESGVGPIQKWLAEKAAAAARAHAASALEESGISTALGQAAEAVLQSAQLGSTQAVAQGITEVHAARTAHRLQRQRAIIALQKDRSSVQVAQEVLLLVPSQDTCDKSCQNPCPGSDSVLPAIEEAVDVASRSCVLLECLQVYCFFCDDLSAVLLLEKKAAELAKKKSEIVGFLVLLAETLTFDDSGASDQVLQQCSSANEDLKKLCPEAKRLAALIRAEINNPMAELQRLHAD